MRRFHFYDPATGLLHPNWFATTDLRPATIHANTPEGHVAIEGTFDPLSQRVDVSQEVRGESGELLKHGPVVDYQPPAPSGEHEWDVVKRRWQLTAAAQQRQSASREAQARIQHLESCQHRAVREALLGSTDALRRLRDLDDAIAEVRKHL